MREIPLTQGKFAIVSAEDYEYLSQWKWYAKFNRGKRWYVLRNESIRTVDGKRKQVTIHMHRVILSRKLGQDDFQCVDHIDGDGLNNHRDNLRPTTHKQNCENREANKNNTSGVRGVCWDKRDKKWVAQIGHNGKVIHLGSFNDIAEAEKAAVAGRNELFTHHTN